MRIEELVPSLELCKMIPAGEFEDSCFVWVNGLDKEPKPICRPWDKKSTAAPAPTLQEILLDLPNWSDLTVDFVNPQISLRFKGKDMKLNPSPAAEALKIWLALKEAK